MNPKPNNPMEIVSAGRDGVEHAIDDIHIRDYMGGREKVDYFGDKYGLPDTNIDIYNRLHEKAQKQD